MSDERGSFDEVNRRCREADPHFRAAIDALDNAIEALGGWFPEDRECVFAVGRLMVAVDLIACYTKSSIERSDKHANERLLAALQRIDEEKHQQDLKDIAEPGRDPASGRRGSGE